MKGVLYKELLESGETITAERYSNKLLKVNKKLQDLGPYSEHSACKIILLHNNARRHILLYVVLYVSYVIYTYILCYSGFLIN